MLGRQLRSFFSLGCKGNDFPGFNSIGLRYQRFCLAPRMGLRIEVMAPGDWPQVRAIYEEGIATGLGTFETAPPSWEEWDAARLAHSRLVAREQGIVGWAALSPVSKRACYAGVAEVGVYVAAAARARGVGRALLEALIESAEAHGIWTLPGATIAENVASLTLQAR